jgi:hypothetical protein
MNRVLCLKRASERVPRVGSRRFPAQIGDEGRVASRIAWTRKTSPSKR